MATQVIPAEKTAGGGGGGSTVTMTQDTYATIDALTPASADRAHATDFVGLTADCFSAGTWTYSWKGLPITPPPTSGWSWDNQGSATIATNGPFLSLETPADGTLQIHSRVRTAPATPWTLTATFHDIDGDLRSLGLVLRESGTGELYRFGANTNVGGQALYLAHNTSPTAGTTQIATLRRIDVSGDTAGEFTVRIEDNGTNLIFSYMLPGGAYQVVSEGRTSRMAAGPDEIGFHIASSGDACRVDLVSWVLE